MLTEQELYAFRRNLVVAASAGTGKTHTLVGVLLHALLGASREEPVDPSRVVATTFSRKAAAELRARLVRELEILAAGGATSKYAAGLDAARAWAAGECARRAREALAGLSRAQIGTLHGFAAALVRRHALTLGLSPGFEIEDEVESAARTRAVIERVVGGHVDGPRDREVRAMARAAGGVDRLLLQIERALARLEEDGRDAGELAVDDGDARAIEARMQSLVELAAAAEDDAKIGGLARAFGAAFRAHDARLEEAAGALLGLSRSRSKSDAAVRLFDLRDTLAKPHEENAETGRRLVRTWRARDRFRVEAEGARALLAECERELFGDARRDSVLGFGSVLRAARDLLRDHPRAAAELSSDLDLLLVDEFQDTSRLQRDIVALLWEEDPAAREVGAPASFARVRPRGLFVVGDRKQSIYGFRGADVGVFAEVCIALAGAPAREALGIPAGLAWEPEQPTADFVPLRHNRRSTPPILAFANAFSARRFRTADPPALYEIAYAQQTEDLLPPSACASASASPSAPGATWLRLPTTRGPSTRLDEAFAIAVRVRAILEAGTPSVASTAAPRFRDIAVLAQTNKMLDACAFAFAQVEVPFVVAGAGFWSAREVRDVVALASCVVDEGDALARLEVLRGPWTGARDETLVALTAPGKGLLPVAEWGEGTRRALVHPDDVAPVARLRALILELSRAAARVAPGTLLRRAVHEMELEEVLVRLPRGAQRVANVRKLLSIADGAMTTRAFLAAARDAAEREVSEAFATTFSEEDDAVRLLTVHASKGLDFPIVFLPEVGSAGAPVEGGALVIAPASGDGRARLAVRIVDQHGKKLDPPSYEAVLAELRRREHAERARLAYVAVTRAAHALFFVGDRKPPNSPERAAGGRAPARRGDTTAYARTTAAALAEVLEGATLAAETPEPLATAPAPAHAPIDEAPLDAARPPSLPSWRGLAVTTEELRDFARCPRRFQLLHLLDVPEPGAAAEARPDSAQAHEGDATVVEAGGHSVLLRGPWQPEGDVRKARLRLLAVATSLVEARLRGSFPGIEHRGCVEIGCGFVGLCHDAPPMTPRSSIDT